MSRLLPRGRAALVTLAALVLTTGLTGCMKMGPIVDYHDELESGLQDALVDEWAETCAPRELALAQSHFTFAKLEFYQGDDRRAEEHLLVARENLALALEAAERCRPRDRDGDCLLYTSDAADE